MHVAVDLNWFLQFIGFAFAAVFGLLYLVRNTASRYFVVDSSFDSSAADYSLDQKKRLNMGAPECIDSCAVCGLRTKKQCAGCKMVKYCSGVCQKSHWNSEHKAKCEELRTFYKANHESSTSVSRRKASVVPLGGSTRFIEPSNKILFPYKDFVKLFNWDKAGYPPCGLLNCGNSCFANVVLQCLAYTRPLLAYLLETGHRIECHSEDWCFFCEFQTHVERAIQRVRPFSPINILSRLPNIGGNLGYGKQEDAHEFMRFAIDNMQSACLDKFGGERAVHPTYQETTLIQHIFGGRLQSQVVCKECNNVSSQFENMMDLTVEIHGDAESLEECLDQFTAKEQLQGDNMYKCDGCNAYVMASKRLLIQRAPNILTIALKRFQSGRFGKLNKKVTFPETLDLRAYMSESEDGSDVYKLYAVIVHVDMLNASFFGHYICYVKDFRGNWYRIDDCKVESVDLDEVLSQGAYMLLYSRIRVRPSSLLPDESFRKKENKKLKIEEIDPPEKQPAECSSASGCLDSPLNPEQPSSASGLKINSEKELSSDPDAKDEKQVFWEPNLLLVKDVELQEGGELSTVPEVAFPPSTSLIDKTTKKPDVVNVEFSSLVAVGDVNRGSKTDGSEGLFTKLVEDSHSAENCTVQEGKNMCDVSALVNTDSTSMPENSKSGNSLSYSCDMQDRSKKSDLGSSAIKLKSVFSPDFLGKHQQKKVSKPQNFSELTPNGRLDNQTNDIGREGICGQNLHVVKEVEFLNSEGLFNAPEVVSPVNLVSRPDSTPTVTSLTDRITKQPGLENVEFSLPDVVEDANRVCVSNANEEFRKLAEESDAAESCTFEKGRSTCDYNGSGIVITTGEFRDEMNPANSTSRLRISDSEKGSPSSHDIHDAAKRSDPKRLKPIFAPGFLVKRPRTEVIKPGDELPANFSELTPNSHFNSKNIYEVKKTR